MLPGPYAPTSGVEEFGVEFAEMRRRIGDLARVAGRRPLALPWGVPSGGYAQVTTTQGTITTAVDLTNLTVTFTAVANRRYRILGVGAFQSTADGDHGRLDLCDGAGTIQQTSQHRLTTANQKKSVEWVGTLSAGSTTRKLQYSRTTGTGSLSLAASANTIAFLIVEDIGPSA